MDNRLKDMELTDDGSMVKVEMTDEGIRSSEPFRYLGVEQAMMLEAQGHCRIKRRNQKEEFVTTIDGKIIVKHIQKPLIDSYGPYGEYTPSDAAKGEETGKWRRCRKGELRGAYETRMMEPRPRVLGHDDLYGSQTYETKGVKKKHIAWIQDSFLRGGAEISSELVIKMGIDCGFSILMLTPETEAETMSRTLQESDLIIINNIWGFSDPQMRVLQEAIYSTGIPYIKYEHDHRELSRPEFSRRLFQNSVMNVFISPVHFENHRQRLGCDGICLPLAIDVDFFKPDPTVERKKGTAITSNVRHFKTYEGFQKYINEHPEITFTILAENQMVRGQNVTVRPMIPYEAMPTLYSEFEYDVHIMDGWGAGERVIFEAALCDCRIVANDKVGHMSWNRDLTDTDSLRGWLRSAPYEFWREIDAKI